MEQWGAFLQKRFAFTDEVIHTLYTQFGYDAESQKLLPDTPAAVGSFDQFLAIVSFLLFQQGIGWTEAELAVQETARLVTVPKLSPSNLQFIGNVPVALQRLRDGGVAIGVITSDNRSMTEEMLAVLEIEHLVDIVVCADDPIPMKPAPDGLQHISDAMGIPTARMVMVGDSDGDMQCGRAAGMAACVRVGPSGNISASGGTLVDVVIETIEEIKV